MRRREQAAKGVIMTQIPVSEAVDQLLER